MPPQVAVPEDAVPFAVAIPPLEERYIVDPTLPFRAQVEKHMEYILELARYEEILKEAKQSADDRDHQEDYEAAVEDLENLRRLVVPYQVAEIQARYLISQSYRLKGFSGTACKGEGDCVEVEAMTALYFLDPTNPAFDGDTPPQEEKHCKVYVEGACMDGLFQKPLDTLTGGLLPLVRDMVIPISDTGEVARLIRDPLKRQKEILQGIRDQILGDDNGEVARIIRDPVKCTLGKLFGKCR
jgi:hypothetical protein